MPFARCDTTALEMQVISVAAAAGNVSVTIEVRNKSSHDCDLYGYAGLQLLAADGDSLPTHAVWTTSSFFLASPAVVTIVGLPAGTPPITGDTPVPGHAYIPLSWNDVVEPCWIAAQIGVIPPDASSGLAISAAPAGGTQSVMTVCSDGTVYVNPTRPAVAR
jgi:hypothetical protein